MELADGLHYCARGYGGQAELLEAVGDKYQLTVYDGEYHTPRWFGEGITSWADPPSNLIIGEKAQ